MFDALKLGASSYITINVLNYNLIGFYSELITVLFYIQNQNMDSEMSMSESPMPTCEQQMAEGYINVGFGQSFDQDQGYAFVFGGEQCWAEVIDFIEEADEQLQQQYEMMESNGFDFEEQGMPTLEQYEAMRDTVTEYTDGNLLMTSWKWNAGSISPGESAGLCVAEEGGIDSYWSCWEYMMQEDMTYPEHPSSYLVDPESWHSTSRLTDYEDITWGRMPMMYGGWMCDPPSQVLENVYAACMRFLPGDDRNNSTDVKFPAGPVRIMTYLTSRDDYNTTMMAGNAALTTEGNYTNPTMEEFQFDLSQFMGATGIASVGIAISAVAALAL